MGGPEFSAAWPALLARVDHLVYATPDLDRGIVEIERLLGVRADSGGRHFTWGTRNALAALGQSTYLEIIAPDHDHSPTGGVRPFGLDRLDRSGLVGWAANASHLDKIRVAAARHGVMLGPVLFGSRQRPDGAILTWTLTDLTCMVADGIVPFFIDWGSSPHPASSASAGATLVSLRAEHPDADRVRKCSVISTWSCRSLLGLRRLWLQRLTAQTVASCCIPKLTLATGKSGSMRSNHWCLYKRLRPAWQNMLLERKQRCLGSKINFRPSGWPCHRRRDRRQASFCPSSSCA